MSAAEDAGIGFSDHIRPKAAAPSRNKPPRARNVGAGEQDIDRQSTPGIPRSPEGRSDLPAPLSGILSLLPADGESWTKDRRDRFVKTFEGILDLCYQIEE